MLKIYKIFEIYNTIIFKTKLIEKKKICYYINKKINNKLNNKKKKLNKKVAIYFLINNFWNFKIIKIFLINIILDLYTKKNIKKYYISRLYSKKFQIRTKLIYITIYIRSKL